MITILTIFCLAALSHVHCGPLQTNGENIGWSLKEVQISAGLQQRPTEHYTSKVKLIRNENTFSLIAAKDGDNEARNILRFEIEELYALLDDAMYVTTQNSDRVIRMTLATKSEAQYFEKFVETAKHGQTFEVIHNYEILRMIELDERLNTKRDVIAVDEEIPISLTVYAGLDGQGNDTGKRRFIISGDVKDDLYAVFNKSEYNFIQKGISNRFVLEVRPPLGFEGKMYYALMMTCRNDTPKNFATEMKLHVSPFIAVPETAMSVVDNL